MNESRQELFDRWAEQYDDTVQVEDTFPYAGYACVLEEIVRNAAPRLGLTVFELGVGTGNLTRRLTEHGCQVWGIDLSANMLDKARKKAPQAVLMQADLLGPWPAEVMQRFDRIVSSYVLHEFSLDTKVALLQRLAQNHLAPEGRIIIGDIGFPTAEARSEAQVRWARLWDPDEYYWVGDEADAACAAAGLTAQYQQVSACAGIILVEPAQIEAP